MTPEPEAADAAWTFGGSIPNPYPGGLGRVRVWHPPAASSAAAAGYEIQQRIVPAGWLAAPYRIWNRTNGRALPDIYTRRNDAETAAARIPAADKPVS